MADTRVVIDVDINTSAAAQGLRDLQQRFNAFTGALNKNNAIQATASRQYADQLMNLVNSGQFFTAEMVRMQTAASRLDKTLAKGQATMGQYFSARFIRNSNAAAQVLSLANARAAALQTQFIATSAAANGMRDAIAIRPYEAFNSALAVSTQKLAIHRAMLMQATTHMINFGKNTQWAGRQLMVGFTVPLTIFGGVAGKVFRELEEQAINFKKVYGDIFTTEAETEQALDAVKELSMEFTKYGIAVKDTMALAGVAAQSGLRNAELMAATTQATRLATLGQMEQAEAMKTIISLQTAFKTSNEGLAESVDFLNIIENQTVLSLQDVAGAIPRVAPVIQGLGGDVKDLAVLLVAMKEGGVTAGEGANALKSSLGRLIVPTRQAKEMAAEFGISLEQIVENNRGQLIPMIMELGRALEGVGDLERQQLLSTIFGKFQYARIGALFDNITRDSSQAARAMDLMGLSAQQLGEIAEKELGVVQESVGARFTAAMERAKVAIAPLGEAFLQLSIPVINFFAQLIEKFNALPDFAKKFAVFGSVLVGVVIPVGTMFLGLLMNLIGTLIKFGAIIGIAFKGFTSGGIKGAIQAVSQALNYMSLEEIDAANAAQQLGQSTQIVNAALRDQVGDAAAATAAIDALGLQYAELVVRMREAAALSGALGPYAVPGAAMGKAAGAQRAAQAVRRNKGGPIPFSTGDTVPGVGNRDTVPAILTPGEFVVNKKAATENRGLLEAINSGEVRKLNGGGPAIPGRAGAAARIAYTTADQFEEMYLAQRNARIGNANVQDDAQAARRAAQRRLSLSEIDQFDENIERIVAESLAEGKFGTQRTHFTPSKTDTLPTPFDPQSPAAQAWLEENIRGTGQKQLLAREMARYGIPFQRLSDDIIDIPGIINQAARSDTNTPMSLNKAAELSRRFRHMFNIDPRSPSAQTGMSGPQLADRLADQLEILARQYPDQLLTDDLLTQARNAAINNQRLNVNPDRYFRIIAKKDLARIAGVPDKIIDARGPNAAKPLNDALNDYFETNNLPFRAEAGSYVRYTGETPSYLPPGTEIRQQFSATPMNAGGIVMDGAQRLFGGGAVLSRAAQLRRVRAAAGPFGIEDNALSKVLKLRFNDAKAARGPADFVKSMFSRWETTPTRISPKENTTMLLKGKKPKYKEVPQEDYLADMIVSMDKFSDTVDAFKPIKIGTGFDGGFRVFDGHTRLHAQTVKSLIAKLTGKDTSSMSREELIEGIRLVQRKSLAGELTDSEILRSVSGQRVLSTRAQRREVELLNERPGRAAPMGSMLNREGRVLLPGVHDKEISAIVEAAKKANFYGVNKDPDSLMQAMGFISLGGGAKYRYEPGRKILGQPERRSFVRNMSRKIIDDLIDAGEILPLKRNKGGIIPGFNQGNIVPGVGRTDTVPAMLTPGEFVVNKDATRRNLDTLKAINNGTIAGFNAGGSAGATNMGPFIPYNPNSGVPPKFPMTGPSSPIKVDIAEVSDRDSAKANKKAAGMGGKAMLAQMGIGTLLSIPGMFAGQAAGEAVGGETGAMVGAMAGSMLPFMLPYGKIGAGLKGMMGRGGKGVASVADDIPITEQLWNTIGKVKPTPAVTANVARTVGMASLFNPLTAAIAAAVVAITATAITFKKMGESNEAEYQAGMELAKSMSTSAEEIRLLGATAKDRAKNMDAYLNASEAQFIQQEYATKIAEAKTKEEKKRIELERDAAIAERGNQTRREAVEDFYKEEIAEAKKRDASQKELRRIYQQRNAALGKRFQEEEQFEIDTTFGAQFIQGQGKDQFDRFKKARNIAQDVSLGNVSSATAETITRMADAAYGMSMSFEKIAERDMASKLAQYVLSGTVTQDQAVSIAEAIGAELGDLQIGKDIRRELTGIVGVEGGRAKYAPGTVATKLAEENEQRISELRNLMYSRAGAMFTTNPNTFRDVATAYATSVLAPTTAATLPVALTQRSRTFDEGKFRRGEPTALNMYNQFFSGMADEFKRNVGSLIELQAKEVQMLEENIAAVGLNYDDLIAKAKTLDEAERLRLERARTITKLQERADAARMQQLQTAFGTTNQYQIEEILKPFIRRREGAEEARILSGRGRDRLEGVAPMRLENFLPNLGDRIVYGSDLFFKNLSTMYRNTFEKLTGTFEQSLPSSMAQLMTSETAKGLEKSYEGTPMQAQFAAFQQQFNAEHSPELYRLYAEFFNDPEFASTVTGGFISAFSQLTNAAELQEIPDEISERIQNNIKAIVYDVQLPVETVGEFFTLVGNLDASQLVEIDTALTKLGDNYGIEIQRDAIERFLPVLSQLGQISTYKMPGLGGKSIVESILGDPKIFDLLGKNDEAMTNLMRFIEFVAGLDPDLQIQFLEDKSINQMIVAGKALESFNVNKFNTALKQIKTTLKDGITLEGQEIEDGVREIELGLERLNEIEDPEIKATLNAEISPLVYELRDLLGDIANAGSAADAKVAFDQALAVYDEISGRISGAQTEEESKPKKPKGSGAAQESPLNQMLRDLRDQISAREKIGKDIYAANEKAKGTFLELRGQGANQAVIDYLQSLSPEEALRVGGELLRDQRKLNSLMGLMSQNAIVQQKEAARAQKERTKAMKFLTDSRVVGQMSAILGSDALDDPEFIEGMMTAAGGKNPNKEQQQFLQAYNARKQAERKYMIAQMPAMAAGEAQRNRLNQRAQFELANKGLSQAEIEVGLGNDAIRMAIEERINQGKGIGPKITKAIKDLAASQKTPIDQLNESIDEILNVYSEVSNILQAGIDKIEDFNIKPLEKELSALQRQNAEYSESQRRLSRSLSDLQEKENDLREEQSKQEESINDYYDSRIDALEKVDKINKNIAAQQQGQLDLAGALSRGDIAAAAKAAQDMRNQAAEQQREQALDNLKTQKEEEVKRFKEAAEEELKNLTIAVNGELLTREQIQGRIDDIDQKIYDNSLKEYELQQKITVEREKQAKIAEAQQKIARASNIVSRLQGLSDPNLSRGEREVMLSAIQAEVSVVGGEGASQLLAYLQSNRENLVSGNIEDPAFAQGLADSVNTFLNGFGRDFASFISPENFKVSAADFKVDGIIDASTVPIEVPDISGILNTAFNSASATVQVSLDNLDSQLSAYEEEVIKKNPFDTLIEGTRTLKRRAKEFLDMIPKKPGSGGGGTEDPEKPEPGKKPKTSLRITTPVDVSESVKEERRDPIVTTRTITKNINGQKIRITGYYDKETGALIPRLTKYELLSKSEVRIPGYAGAYATYEREDFVEVGRDRLPVNPDIFGFSSVPGMTPPQGVIPDQIPAWMRTGQPNMPGWSPETAMEGTKPKTSLGPMDLVKGVQLVLTPTGQIEIGWGLITGIIDAMANATGDSTLWEQIATGTVNAFKSIFDIQSPSQHPGIIQIGKDLIGNLEGGIIGGMVSWFTSPIVSLWNNFKSYFGLETGTGENGSSPSTKTGIFGTNLIQGIFNAITDMLIPESIQRFLSSGFNFLLNGIKSLLGIDTAATQDNENTPKGMGKKSAGQILSGFVSGLLPANITALITNPIGTLLTTIAGLLGITDETLEKDGAPLSIGKKIVTFLLDGVGSMLGIDNISAKISEHFENFKTGLNNFFFGENGNENSEGSWIYRVGSRAVQAVINGFKSIDLGSALRGIVRAAVDALPQAVKQFVPDDWKNAFFGGPIKRAFGGNINYRPPTTAPPGMMFGGKMKKFAMGSFVPGIGNTDTVPALLTPGEFVVRKSVAQTYGPLLNALNSDVFPKMTMTSLMPSSSKTSSDGQVSYNYAINVNVSGSNASPDDIANTVMSKIKMMESRNIRGTRIG